MGSLQAGCSNLCSPARVRPAATDGREEDRMDREEVREESTREGGKQRHNIKGENKRSEAVK